MKRIAQPSIAPFVFVGASALIGCAHEHAAPVATAPPPVGITQTTSHVVTQRPTATATAPTQGIHVSDEILNACDVDFSDVDSAPQFDFDKSDLRPGERTLLEKVAT